MHALVPEAWTAREGHGEILGLLDREGGDAVVGWGDCICFSLIISVERRGRGNQV